MRRGPKSLTEEPFTAREDSLRLLIQPEPWLRLFLRNLRDLFRPEPPQVWITAPAAEYWPDALVNRPVAWSRMRQSFLGHILIVVSVYWITLLWINRPQVIPQQVPQTTITHYQLSEYLPPVNAQTEKPAPPTRKHAQKADPEQSPQEIVSIHADHTSLRQTIVHPNPNVLANDTPLPNIVAWTPIPNAAPVAANRPLQNLPAEMPRVVPPAQQVAQSHLVFPVLPQPEVIGPASRAATTHSLAAVSSAAPSVVQPAGSVLTERPALAVNGPVVVPPSQQPVTRGRLQLPAQAPDVAAPAAPIARRELTQPVPLSRSEVVPPSQNTTARPLADIRFAPPAQPAVPPSQPIAAGDPVQSQAMGQLLALNARPVAPVGPVSVPEGNRRGEFAAGPAGRPGATARPEIAEEDHEAANRSPGNSRLANLYVSAPPVKIAGNNIVAAPPSIPPVRSISPDSAAASVDPIDTRVFGARRNYSIRLSMPNLNSAIGSWLMRFARLNSEPGHEEDISAPEPLRKVDPAYPASYVHDRVEGVVVLHAIIRSDGSVSEVRILEGFDSRLDENARAALEQWRFRPGTRNGVPVDVEAVVRVPFRVPKAAF
jgi:TonB family protein